jgi:hypothetical protein
MNTGELVGLVSAGPNATLLAALGSDTTWNVAEDWGLGAEWKVERVPVGIKFRHSTNGLVTEEVLVARGSESDRAAHDRLLGRSLIPTHLVLVDRPHVPHNRLRPHFLSRQVGSDS